MSLAVPVIPDNLRAQPGLGRLVDADMFNICERIREVDPRLFIYELPDGGTRTIDGRVVRFSIAELCADGVMRLVYRAGELDERVVKHCEYLLKVPFAERFAKAEALEAAVDEKRKEDEFSKLYENMGRPMWTELERCGFAERGVSYPKRGVKR